MSSKGHRPERTCLGCGARECQDRLIRLALTGEGRLIVDRKLGRGGYLHRNPDCWHRFIGRKGQYRAFHVDIARATKERLINELKLKGRERE